MESVAVPSSTFGDILDQLCLSTLRYHWQSVLTSTVVFAIIYEISRIFSPVLFPKTFQFFKGVSVKGVGTWLYGILMYRSVQCAKLACPRRIHRTLHSGCAWIILYFCRQFAQSRQSVWLCEMGC